MIRQLPNLVSLLRVALAPVIFQALLRQDFESALWWLILAAFTDFLDGFLARRLGVVSRAGAYLDPIGDKVLLSGTYLILWITGAIPSWLGAIVFGRDGIMLVFIAVAMLARQARDFPPTIWGKLSTVVQILTALVVILSHVSFGSAVIALRPLSYVLAAAATLWSGLDYLRIGVGILRGGRAAEPVRTLD